jgi:hypothetical protein
MLANVAKESILGNSPACTFPGKQGRMDREKRRINKARALSNPDLSPHLSFVDMGATGYAVGHVTGDILETEFVRIPVLSNAVRGPVEALSCIARGTEQLCGIGVRNQSWSCRYLKATHCFQSEGQCLIADRRE